MVWLSTATCIHGLMYTGIVSYESIITWTLPSIDYYTGPYTGWNLTNYVREHETQGYFAVIIVLNELLEPLRLPFVVATTKQFVDLTTKTFSRKNI